MRLQSGEILDITEQKMIKQWKVHIVPELRRIVQIANYIVKLAS